MISDRRIFGANRLIVAGLVALFAVSAALIFLPGATDYMAYGTFGRRLSFLNSWEPEHRLLLAYVFTGISAAAAVSSLRWLIDNTMVVVDSEGSKSGTCSRPSAPSGGTLTASRSAS